MKRSVAHFALIGCLGLPAASTVALAATTASVVTAPAAHADDWNCDDSYMPCDGANMDYLTGDVPPPSDPIYNQGLGDDGSSLVSDPVDPSVFSYGLGDNGESLADPWTYDSSWNDNYDAWNGWDYAAGQPDGG